MELARLFVGLPLPASYQDGLGALVRALRRTVPGQCSWTRPGNWHVTLKFLGETPLEALPDIQAALAAVAWEPFVFRAGGGGYFPSAERPRVMWVGAARGAAELRALAGKVDQALGVAGFAPESRPFAAHLTVARVKASRPGADWKKPLGALLAAQWPEITADRFTLWRSFLGGESEEGSPAQPGPRYVPLGEYGAGG